MSSLKEPDMAGISAKSGPNARWIALAVILLVIVAAVFLWLRSDRESTATVTYDVQLVPLRTDQGLEFLYRAVTPVREITIPFPADRISELTVTESADIVTLVADGDYVTLRGSADIELTGLLITPDSAIPANDYPAVQFGTGAVAINMPLFTPVMINGTPVSGDASLSRFAWMEEGGTPAAVDHQVLVDPGLPATLAKTIAASLDPLITQLEASFARPLKQIPQFMLLYEEGAEGQLRIEADAAPGQVLIKYTGQSFAKDLPEARRLVTGNLAHELVHLWQLEEPGVAAAPDWLHEGAANALSAEALFVAGIWDEAAYGDALMTARRECAASLREGTIVNASRNGNHHSGYACGHIIMAATAGQRSGATIAAMWRAFVEDVAEDKRGMSAAAFYEFSEGWAGTDRYTSALRKFITMNYAYSDHEDVIDQLFAGTL